MTTYARALVPFALIAAFVSCSGCSFGPLSGRSITILTYNVENLFDDVDNGTEYREYDPGSGDWNSDLFHKKLQHVAEVLRSVSPGGADLVALQEVENEKALSSLNDLYLKGMGYRALLAATEGSAVCVALLTRFPASRILLHRVVAESEEPLRSILEVEVEAHGDRLVLLVNHWKSKLGEGETTEPLRRASAAVVARRLAELQVEEPGVGVVVLGDLNEQYDEFALCGRRYRTALIPAGATALADGGALPSETTCDGSLRISGELPRSAASLRAAGAVCGAPQILYDPWSGCVDQGSTWYSGRWETIDHILIGPALLVGGGLRYESFAIVRKDFMLDPEGRPLRFSSTTGAGYSDHVPLLVTLSRHE